MTSLFARCCLALFVVIGSAQAANNSTNSYYEIKNLIFWSKTEPVYPNWAGYVSVEFTQSLAWVTAGVCHSTTVAIRPQDNHVMSAVQTAFASGRSVRLYVDDSQRIDGNICILRALQY